jgi:hypothetical protein
VRNPTGLTKLLRVTGARASNCVDNLWIDLWKSRWGREVETE